MNEIKVPSPITGLVIEISVSIGDTVAPGALLAVFESMKMENELLSEYGGAIKDIKVRENQNISEGETVLLIDLV